MHWGGDLWPWLGSVGCQMAARARVVLCACFWGVSGGMPAKWAKGPRGAAPTKTGASLAAAAAAKRRPVKLSAACSKSVVRIGCQLRLGLALSLSLATRSGPFAGE
jgi:hypothetical protein